MNYPHASTGGVPPVPPQLPDSRSNRAIAVLMVLSLGLGLVLGSCATVAITSLGRPPSRAAAPAPLPGASPLPTAIPPARRATPQPPATSQPGGTRAKAAVPMEGIHPVGKDAIRPGYYITVVPEQSHGCFWARRSANDKSLNSLIRAGVGVVGSGVEVRIKDDDAYFESSGCGTWKRA